MSSRVTWSSEVRAVATTGVMLRGRTVNDLPEFARLAEGLGYDSVWQVEGRGGDQFSVLTACALATDRIGLGTNISSIFVRTAPLIAMAAATVDRYSGGRFILGLGTDHAQQVMRMHGQPFSKPIPRMLDTVEIVRQLIRDGEVSYDGEIFDIEHFDLWLEPIRSELPIYLAAVNPKMLGIAGETGQGVIMVYHTVDSVRDARAHIMRGAERAGKQHEDVVVSTMIPCAVASDRDDARELMRHSAVAIQTVLPRYTKLLHDHGFGEEWDAVLEALREDDRAKAAAMISDSYLGAFTITGTPTQARERLEAWREAGIDLPILVPVGDDRQALEAVTALAPGAA